MLRIIINSSLTAGLALGLFFLWIHFSGSKTVNRNSSSQASTQVRSSVPKTLGDSLVDNSPTIKASSNAFAGDDRYAPEYLMQEGRTLWHAISPPEYPEWVEISFPKPVLITHLGLRSQVDSVSGKEHARGPKNFVFQGSNDASESSGVQKIKKWRYLFKAENSTYAKGEEWKDWFFRNSTAFRYYRIYIKAGADPNYLTIRQIRLDSADKLSEPVKQLPGKKTIASAPSAKESLPSDFDWRTYVENYKDLQTAGIDTKEKAAEHWLTVGKKEGRSYRELPLDVPDVPYMPWRRND